jgi:hypothetical protein
MLKNISNSKLFFVALGITIGLCGMRVYAGPGQDDLSALKNQAEKIADSLDRIQRNGLEIKQGSVNRLHVTVDNLK